MRASCSAPGILLRIFTVFPLLLSYTWASYWHRAHSLLEEHTLTCTLAPRHLDHPPDGIVNHLSVLNH